MYEFLLVRHCNYGSICTVCELFDLQIWRTGHTRSLKLVPFESLGAVSYSPSIVTMAVCVAVCEIFSVKAWCDLENRVRVRSRSLEMAPSRRTDGQADKQTELLYQYHASVCWRAIKIVCYLQKKIFNRNRKLKQQVTKLSALKLGVCSKIYACYIFICIFFQILCQNSNL